MGGYNQKPVNLRWDQSGFDALKKSWTAARAVQDQKDLTAVFNLAAQVPAAAAALDWAQAHGIEYMIDGQCVRVGGYYQGGTGVVALSRSILENPVRAVAVLTHETRHAWQDAQGFLQRHPIIDGFAGYFVKMSLIEADAYAHEMRAQGQAEQFTKLGVVWQVPETFELADEFMNWFSDSGRPALYGEQASKAIAQMWSIPGAAALKFNVEFNAVSPPLRGTPLNIGLVSGVAGLGATFSGAGNYLTYVSPDKMALVIDKDAACGFYGAADGDQRALVAAIQQKEKSPEGRMLKILTKGF